MFGWEFPPFNSGGLGTACFGLTKALSSQDAKVIFVLPKKLELDVDFLKLVYADDGSVIDKEYFVNSLLSGYSTDESYICKLGNNDNQKKFYGSSLFDEVERYGAVGEKIALEENFDVIHAHDWLTFKAALAAKKVTGRSLVVHIHATEFDRTGDGKVNQYVYDIEKQGMQEADLVIAVSNFTKNKIIKNYGIQPDKIRVVHNSVEFEEYALQKIHDLKKTKKIVLFLGRLTLQKGPDYFVYTAKKVLQHYPDVVFVVAGSGDMETAVINKVAELGLSDKFIFAGFLRGEDIYKAYKMADLYVMPSVSEPFGITPLESLKCGTPALISHQSGVSEIITHCLKSDFWDVDDMANKIVSVLRYKELHSCLQNNGTKEIIKQSWNGPAARCMDIYKELAGRKKK